MPIIIFGLYENRRTFIRMKKKPKLFLYLTVLLFAISCKKENTHILKVKVVSPENEPIDDIRLNLLNEGIVISHPRDGITTSGDGMAAFSLEPNRRYNLYLIGNERYNSLLENPGTTYISVGVFKSDEEINNYPRANPTDKVGDPKYADINGDGLINEYDLVLPIQTPKKGNLDLTLILSLRTQQSVTAN